LIVHCFQDQLYFAGVSGMPSGPGSMGRNISLITKIFFYHDDDRLFLPYEELERFTPLISVDHLLR